MMKAIRVHVCGGPEALRYDDVAVPTPQPGEAVVKIAAAGVNFIDVQHRAGRYKPPALPFTLGSRSLCPQCTSARESLDPNCAHLV